MTGAEALYREAVLEHQRAPRNFGPPTGPCTTAVGSNPLCGDRVEVHVRLAQGLIDEARFEGHGCAISVASASMMTEAVRNRPVEEALGLARTLGATLRDRACDAEALGPLAPLAAVRRYPSRIRCALLAWSALEAALRGESCTVTTETEAPPAGAASNED